MKKIMDVYGYYTQYGDYYHLDNCWNGRIILNEDKTFTGIAKSTFDDSNEHFLLFGDVGLGLSHTYIVSNEEAYPRYYKGVREADALNKYEGVCYATDGEFYLPIGESRLVFDDAEKNRDYSEEEIKQIRDGIELVKATLNDAQTNIYNRIIENNSEVESKIIK